MFAVYRYVERNPWRARRVERAEAWRWSSQGLRGRGQAETFLDPWPVEVPGGGVGYVNQPETAAELQALRRSAMRGSPCGRPGCWRATARLRGLQSTRRPHGWTRGNAAGWDRDDQRLLFREEP